MIISASYRTDVPAFYGRWFIARLAAGAVEIRNPYNGRMSVLSLAPADVDGFVFWTRNAAPFLEALERVAALGRPFVVQYSILDYPRVIDRAVPPAARQIAVAREIARRHGPKVVVWRHDPIVLSDPTPAETLAQRFERLAARLALVTDEVVISFAHAYAKTRRRLDAAARAGGFSWREPALAEKLDLTARLGGIAAEHGMRLTVCAQPDLAPAAPAARCVDAERLAAIAGRPIHAPEAGNRPGCACARSRDIGAYDTCPHGCVYCYAVSSDGAAKRNHARHDPAGGALPPALEPGWTASESSQISQTL